MQPGLVEQVVALDLVIRATCGDQAPTSIDSSLGESV